MQVHAMFHEPTFTLTYVVYDEVTRDAVVIDPVLDYDPKSSQTATDAAEALVHWISDHGLRVHLTLETHAHADHLSGAPFVARALGAEIAIGEHIRTVQRAFEPIFGLPEGEASQDAAFDRLLADGEVVTAGSLQIRVLHTPGHTPACVSYLIGDAVFTGDALFMPDYGTGRCDFPAGSAEALYTSVHDKLYALPDSTRVFVGHDYQPGGRELRYETTIGASKRGNIQLKASTTQTEFVRFRKQRDATLEAPRLLFPSVAVNIHGGRLPAPDASGIRRLKIPLNLFHPSDDCGTVISEPKKARAI